MMLRRRARWQCMFIVAIALAVGASACDSQSGPVTFTIDAGVKHPISRFIYGANFIEPRPWGGVTAFPPFTLDRIGGNRLSAYNWENNFSNAGNDYLYQNDDDLSASRAPGAAVAARVDAARSRGQASIVTVPLLPYLAADANGPMDAADSTRTLRLATRFKLNRAAKPGLLSPTPNPGDDFVYQDEFVAWLAGRYPGAMTDSRAPIMFTLDNEPDLWTSTHAEVYSKVGEREPRVLTYAEFLTMTVDYARAIKRVAPGAVVFGPGVANWAGMATLGRYPRADPEYGGQFFLDVYLDQLRRAQGAGQRLLDVLDVHWYPESGADGARITDDAARQTPAMIAARLQAPRSLWDPAYDEGSWVSRAAGGAVRLLPRLRDEIAAHYPRTKTGISEYYFGAGGAISGAIAQADALGIFGREGVFAAAVWPAADLSAHGYAGDGKKAYAYLFGAFDMYLDYDGAHGRFGDTGISALTSDPVRSSVYASMDSANRVIVVAINKTSEPLPAVTSLSSGLIRAVHVYSLTGASATPARQPDLAGVSGNTFTYPMPPLSVSTLVVDR